MEGDEIRMPLTSADVTAEHLEGLKELLPEAFTEGKVDFERLRQTLGDVVDTGRERYGLSWAGKADAIRAVQTPSVGTLIPAPGESVNFDTTENLIIEGENLEVLKLLQKSYHGKIKMIYIDPPYNTGNEFIYSDDYKEPLKQYLHLTGQVSEEGVKLTTNTETSGRYHSNWLSMMYPRLFLARNLLRDDGVIFVSIDDHEIHNLRLLMDEIFGPENFLGCVVRATGTTTGQDAKGFGSSFDYVLAYARSDAFSLFGLPLSEKDKARFNNEDERGRYSLLQLRKTGSADRKEDRPSMYYPITAPDGSEVLPVGPGGYKSRWRFGQEKYNEAVKDKLIEWKKTTRGEKTTWIPYVKYYLEGRTKRPSPLWIDLDGNKKASLELKELLGEKVFENPKPTALLLRLIRLSTSGDEDLILDFFAGSGTTAHGVIQANNGDGGARKFILIQLPEPTDEGSPARSAGYQTIADICKDRIRRVIGKMRAETSSQLLPENGKLDLGFRVFKLASSNFKIWEGEKVPQDAEGLAEQLKLYADHVLEGRSQRDILYELILKSGLPLTAKIEEKAVTGKTVYSVADGLLLICLEDEVTAELLRGMMDLKPQQIICLDRAFRGNDQLKTNTVLEMKQRKITFHTV